MKKRFSLLCGLMFAASFASGALFAKEVNMYDQPKTDAKVVSKVDSSSGIIPIYSPKDVKGWIKIADPSNGNVGWIKTDDLKDENLAVVQKVIMAPAPQVFQTTTSSSQPLAPIQFEQPRALTETERQQMLQRLQMEQQEMQQSTQQLMQSTMRYLNFIFQEQARILSGMNVNPLTQPNLPPQNQPSMMKTPANIPAIAPAKSPLNPSLNNQ